MQQQKFTNFWQDLYFFAFPFVLTVYLALTWLILNSIINKMKIPKYELDLAVNEIILIIPV